MNEESTRILQLVEEGKITADDAVKLLYAISANASAEENCDSESNDFEKKVNNFAKNAEAFARECGSKVSGAYRVVEPKLRKVSKAVLTKTASVIDDLSKALNESLRNMENNECDDECCCNETACCCDEDHGCCDSAASECTCGCDCDDTPKEN